MDHRAVSDNRDLTTITQYFTLADLEQLRFAIDRSSNAVPARITHRRRASVFEHRKQHVAHLAFVFRRHQDDVGDRAKICNVEQPVVSLSVAAGNSTAIETKLYVQILNADVVDYLVEAALKKRRIDRANGFQSFARHSSRERDAVLLRDTDVKRSLRKFFERAANACAVRHRGSQ